MPVRKESLQIQPALPLFRCEVVSPPCGHSQKGEDRPSRGKLPGRLEDYGPQERPPTCNLLLVHAAIVSRGPSRQISIFLHALARLFQPRGLPWSPEDFPVPRKPAAPGRREVF